MLAIGELVIVVVVDVEVDVVDVDLEAWWTMVVERSGANMLTKILNLVVDIKEGNRLPGKTFKKRE